MIKVHQRVWEGPRQRVSSHEKAERSCHQQVGGGQSDQANLLPLAIRLKKGELKVVTQVRVSKRSP